MRAALIIALLAMSICWAQLPERFTTIPGELSGYFWLSMSRVEQVNFIYGFQSGYHYSRPDNTSARNESRDVCIAQFKDPSEKQKFDCTLKSLDAKSNEYKRWDSIDPFPGGRYGDIVEATDRFFAEPENRVMPITAAWLTNSKMETRGSPAGRYRRLLR